MTYPEDFTLEQQAILIVAEEEGFVVNIIGEYGARLAWAETGNTRTPSKLSEEAKRHLIPRFKRIVVDLVRKGAIEVCEPVNGGWTNARSLSSEEVEAALDD